MRKALYIFGKLADRDIDWLISNGAREELEDGAALIRKGGPIGVIYINLAGSLAVYRDEAEKQKIARLGVGELVGEMSFVDSRPASVTVKAEGSATVFSISRDRLYAHLQEDDGFGSRFYQAIAIFLADRLRRTVGINEYDEPSDREKEGLDELNDLITDTVSMAGDRFQRLLNSVVKN